MIKVVNEGLSLWRLGDNAASGDFETLGRGEGLGDPTPLAAAGLRISGGASQGSGAALRPGISMKIMKFASKSGKNEKIWNL